MPQLFQWIAGLAPAAQILVIVALFATLVGVALFLIEVAPRSGTKYTIIRLAACVAIPAGVLVFVGTYPAAIAVAAVLGGGFYLLDLRSRRGKGYLFQIVGFLAPAGILVTIGLVIPSIQTGIAAFRNRTGERWVGFQNFEWIFTQPAMQRTVINTVIWVLLVPVISTILGLAYAVFIDKSRGERIYKALVFMPMAISFVGASIIWRFMYTQRPPGSEQIGLLNQILVWLGFDPINFLATEPWNTLFLIIVLIWIQTGFAMVVLSAAIKGVPAELNEAAELDGANAWQRFSRVTVPSIRPALIVVVTTISIASLKVFDIVRTMTAGANNTSVVANEMYTQFRYLEYGRSAAFALLLFVLVLPIVVYNARQIKKQREVH